MTPEQVDYAVNSLKDVLGSRELLVRIDEKVEYIRKTREEDLIRIEENKRLGEAAHKRLDAYVMRAMIALFSVGIGGAITIFVAWPR